MARHEFDLRRDLVVVVAEQQGQQDPRQLVQQQEQRLVQIEQKLGGGVIPRCILVYPSLGRSLITLPNGLGQESVGAVFHACDSSCPRGFFSLILS